MPPSPVMRVSPGRGLKFENHKRGRSLENAILYREKEDDLALFNEVGNKERDGFLLQSNENIDDFFSTKLRCFSGYKLGVSVPPRGESSDLLNVDRDKNDYDWLITPPETPLFRSLDDEAQPVKLAPRGRPKSQPVSVSRSSTMDKDYRGSRGVASPHRLRPSPRSGNSSLQSRSRPFPANHTSPPPTMRHTSPLRRLSLSPPPIKPASASRSSTPTPRRLSTSSPSRVRGSSPINTSRGNSASPKLRSRQTNIPGFSSEAPPNLLTSLEDRTASHVRGASPSSRNSSQYGRQSTSPTASRSVASSHSHKQDPFSPYSKCSVASSGDDDVESPQSVPLRSSEQSARRNVGAHLSNDAMNFSRKPTKKLLSSSPKRSLDLVRQMDRNGPHNMFRPLLSSVPSSTFHAGQITSSTFHAGQTSAHQLSLTSINSSTTTSSSASGAHNAEGGELNQEDVTRHGGRGNHPGMEEDEVPDRDDDVNEDIEHGSQHGENHVPPIIVSTLDVGSSYRFDATVAVESPVLVLDREHDCSDAEDALETVMCSKCGDLFYSAEEVINSDLQLCLECRSLEVRSTLITHGGVQIIGHGSEESWDQTASTSGCGKNHLETQNSYSDSGQSLCVEQFEEGEPTSACEKVMDPLQSDEVNSSSRLDVSGGAGISLLLKKTSSVERHNVQSRSYTASATSYDALSYARDSLNSTRSSVSTSTDLGSYRQTEFRNLLKSVAHKSDSENSRSAKLKRSISSVSSSASGNMFHIPNASPSLHEDGYEEITDPMDKEFGEETRVDSRERSLAFEFTEAESTCSDVESNAISTSASEPSSRLMNSQETASDEKRGILMNNCHNSSIRDTSSVHSWTSDRVDGMDAAPTSCADMVDAAEVGNPSSLNAISEKETEDADAYHGSNSDVDSTDEIQLHDARNAVRATVKEFEISHHAHVVREGSRVLLEDSSEVKAKTLTLEEAADAILFCSSIIHNLAYEAANFAIDNEAPQVDVLQPAAKSNSGRWDTRTRKLSSESQKARKRSIEMEAPPSSCNAETNEDSSPCIDVPSDDRAPDKGESTKPPNQESKCNCLIM